MDLLLEVERLDWLVQHTDAKNYARCDHRRTVTAHCLARHPVLRGAAASLICAARAACSAL